jgi:murein DD-endopeptidase MepM/ murein hydrolase activator NlpD
MRMRTGATSLVLGAVAVLVVACGPKHLQYTVEPGDSVRAIAARHGVSYEALVRANRLRHPDRIVVGRVLRIPEPEPTASRAPADGVVGFVPPAPASASGFQWPLRGGVVTSPFGRRDGGHHDGIDIQAPRGTTVHAAGAGRVLHSGWVRGYGNVLILDHGANLATVYAHNERNFVQTGTLVRRGQPIAALGATGRTSAPHLHFEVRRQNLARDPLRFLPPMRVASRRTQGGS